MTTMTRLMDHAAHSRLVRFWKPKETESLHTREWDINSETTSTLVSPHDGYVVAVYFSTVPSVPGKVVVRSTNWRTEHEPRFWVSIEEARAFYRQLVSAGFVKKQ